MIESLMEDHKKILEFVDTFEIKLIDFMKHDRIQIEDYRKAITFIREFADKEHHQKEEKGLFKYMVDHLGDIAINLVRHGMMVEHDQGRLFIKTMEDALDRYEQEYKDLDKLLILSNGHAYCELIRRHIDKEDRVVFTYAKRMISEEVLKGLEDIA